MSNSVLPEKCPDCATWHGLWPREHRKPGEPCGHNPFAPCEMCNEPVGGLSMGGPSVCARCDAFGPPRDKRARPRSALELLALQAEATESEV